MYEKLEQEIVSQRASMDTCSAMNRYPEVPTAKELLKPEEAGSSSDFFTSETSQLPEINPGDQEMPSMDICGGGMDIAPDTVNPISCPSLFHEQEQIEGSTSTFFTAQSSEPPDMEAIDEELASIDICGGEQLDLQDVFDKSPALHGDEEKVERFFTAETSQPPVLDAHSQDIPSIDECGGTDITMDDVPNIPVDEPVIEGNFSELFTAETSKPPIVCISEQNIPSADICDEKNMQENPSVDLFDGKDVQETADSCSEDDSYYHKIHKSRSVRNGLSQLGDITFDNYFTLTSLLLPVSHIPDIKTHSMDVFGGADYNENNQTSK